MLHEKHLIRIDNTLQHIRDNKRPFGGVQIILGGDFNQLPPITTTTIECSHNATISASIKSSPYFKDFRSLSWAQFLITIAHGQGQPIFDGPFGSSQVQFQPGAQPTVLSENQLRNYLNVNFPDPSALQMIAPFHQVVNDFNKQQLHHYFSEQEIVELPAYYTFAPGLRMTAEDIRYTHRNNIPDDRLCLAVSAPVFVMRNINIAEGLANGAIGKITKIAFNAIEVLLLHTNTTHSIPRISFSIGQRGQESIRHQFPLQLAFGATINKVQGKTSSKIVVNLVNQCFTHGQLYVALSRVRDFQQLAVVLEGHHIAIQNIVFQQLVFR